MDNAHLLEDAENTNIQKLNNEIQSLESLGFSKKIITGYGEGVFMVTVFMANENGIEVSMQIPQSIKEGNEGVVRIKNRNHSTLPNILRDFYRF